MALKIEKIKGLFTSNEEGESLKFNERGQAAVTDALYFLLVVTGISILLFSFANTYGNAVSDRITSNYNTTFSTDTLKTILYSSTPRDPLNSLYGDSTVIEIDHLLAYIKEDFSDDGILSETTKQVVAQNIVDIMRPVSSNFDYAFYISIKSDKFVFLFMKTTVAGFDLLPNGEISYVPDYGETKYYFCGENETEPVNSPNRFSAYNALSDELSKLLVNVGETSAASSRIKLTSIHPAGASTSPQSAQAQVDLVIWNSTDLENFYNRNTNPLGTWKCIDKTSIFISGP